MSINLILTYNVNQIKEFLYAKGFTIQNKLIKWNEYEWNELVKREGEIFVLYKDGLFWYVKDDELYGIKINNKVHPDNVFFASDYYIEDVFQYIYKEDLMKLLINKKIME